MMQEHIDSGQPDAGTAAQMRYGQQLEAAARQWHGDRGRLRADLAAELGLEGNAPLDDLIALGITPDTAPAFEALPLVEVAWADGNVDSEERWRVLSAATAFGLELGRPAHAQLEFWLTQRPQQELLDAWYRFAAWTLSRGGAASHARRMLDEAQNVAAATGGLLGYGAVSNAERAAVTRIREALGEGGEARVD